MPLNATPAGVYNDWRPDRVTQRIIRQIIGLLRTVPDLSFTRQTIAKSSVKISSDLSSILDPQPMTNSPPDPQPVPLTEVELDLLKEEYFFVQQTIEDYNKQIWAIKALGIAGTGAVLALTIQQKAAAIALVGSAIPLFFWILESQWKHFQRSFYPRVAELEAIANGAGLRGPYVYNSWSRSVNRAFTPKRSHYWRDGLFNPSVFLSYVLEIVFLLLVGAIGPALWAK